MDYNNYIRILIFFFLIILIIFIIKIFLGLYMSKKSKYIVVFDLDETLGHFTELGVFCDVIQNYNKNKLTFNEFYKIMELFPEFLRPNILQILSYLKTKKQRKECYKVIIYTNNQGPKEWAQFIRKYFETKLNYKLFDQLIAAYKINGKKLNQREQVMKNLSKIYSKLQIT